MEAMIWYTEESWHVLKWVQYTEILTSERGLLLKDISWFIKNISEDYTSNAVSDYENLAVFG